MKQILIGISALLFCFSLLLTVQPAAAAEPITVYFFWGDGCPHCAQEEEFLAGVQTQAGVEVRGYEVWSNRANQELLQQVGERLETRITGVPFTVIGDRTFTGYYTDETTGAEIQRAIDECQALGCPDIVGAVIAGTDEPTDTNVNSTTEPTQPVDPDRDDGVPDTLNVPLLGSVDTRNLSLPVLTVVIAAVDGFNPCAMWALGFLIMVLLGMRDRKRMWLLGSVFILTSGFVYFLFMTAWLEFFRAVGYLWWIRSLIGVAAVVIGIYYLRRFWKMRPGVCEVTNPQQRKKLMDRITDVVHRHSLWLALVGIIGVAALVNLVEFFCSFGLPAVYTEALAVSGIEGAGRFLYLLLYILIFMLDDLIIFSAAMLTMRLVGTEGKYSRYATLIGGIVIFVLGIMLIFKPGWIMG